MPSDKMVTAVFKKKSSHRLHIYNYTSTAHSSFQRVIQTLELKFWERDNSPFTLDL